MNSSYEIVARTGQPDHVELVVLRPIFRHHLVQFFDRFADPHDVAGGKRDNERDLFEWQLVRMEDRRLEADVGDTVARTLQHHGRLQQRPGIGLLPVDLDIEVGRLYATIDLRDPPLAQQSERRERTHRLAGCNRQIDLLLGLRCRRQQCGSDRTRHGHGHSGHRRPPWICERVTFIDAFIVDLAYTIAAARRRRKSVALKSNVVPTSLPTAAQSRLLRARQAHGEHRALARLARHRHVAAHHARELAGDGEARARCRRSAARSWHRPG